MKISKIETPFPAISIDDFIPSVSLARAASASFDTMPENDWVKYSTESGQVQFCSKNRSLTPAPALTVLDYISSFFNPDDFFKNFKTKSFPDMSYYGGGMMITPNSSNEGGYLGMHVDADVHGINLNWKREYSAILCLSEEYDSSFDLLIHDGDKNHGKIPYKFNRLNIFKCSENSWHGLPKISNGLDRKTLGVMFWSIMTEEERLTARVKAKFNNSLKF